MKIFNFSDNPAVNCRRAFQGSAAAPFGSFDKLNHRTAVAALTIAVALLCTVTSCSKKQPVLDSQTQAAIDAIDQQNKEISASKAEDGSVLDFDLTSMSANMVYAQIFNLMMEPETYAGKTFKMKGNFIKVNGPDGKPAYAVIIKDALACCQQGVEFKYEFKGNEPAPDQLISVIGTYTVTENADGMMHNFVNASTIE